MFHIVQHDLEMKKAFQMNSELSKYWSEASSRNNSKAICRLFEDVSYLLDRIVNVDESWVDHYDPENKEQSKVFQA